MDFKNIIIIVCLLILIYQNLPYIRKIAKLFIKYLKNQYNTITTTATTAIIATKFIDIKSDLSLVKKEQNRIVNYIKKTINKDINNEKLSKIIIYVTEDGKKIRPVIITSIFKKLNNLGDTLTQDNYFDHFIYDAAISIEYLHCASLIIDDIMDHDDERRGKDAVHIKYGLSTAQLTAVILCSISLQKIFDSYKKLSDSHENVNKNIAFILGDMISNMLKNLSIGQYLDININNEKTKLDIDDLIKKKTGSLFEYCFILPWILTNYNKNDDELKEGIEKMKKIATLFGFIFQIADDFEDIEQDLQKENQNSLVNYVVNKGHFIAYEDFNHYVKKFTKLTNKNNISTPEIDQMIEYLSKKVNKYYEKHKL